MNTIKSSRALGATLAALGAVLLGTAPLNATSYDLTLGGSVTIPGPGNAVFTTTNAQATGTGIIDPFLRLQANRNETGLNSDSSGANLLADTKQGSWTHDITLGNIGTQVINGVLSYVFLLDINQNGSDPLISLDTFQVYTRSTSITANGGADTLAEVQAGGVLRYNLDNSGANEVLLDYSLNSGSGSGDLFVYIPVSAFGAAASTDFVYVYTQFGNKGGVWESNDGFEEWATLRGGVERVPDGGTTVALLGLALASLAFARRKLL